MNANSEHDSIAAALRALPSVDALLRHYATATLLQEHPRGEVVAAIRQSLDDARHAILAGKAGACDFAGLALAVRERLMQRSVASLRRVINATGIVLHTGLGRAPLAQEAVEAVAAIAGGYSNLELDLESGERGDRHAHVRELLRELTGAEDALVVNNNAAATYLALRALAVGREVVVSRGQLVEIGGSYRMPEIMAAAGCRMVEVGTTNRTRIGDYAAALTDHTAALVRVHTSNYRIVGFTESAPLRALVELAAAQRPREIWVIDDLGSGLLHAGVLGASACLDDGERRAGGEDPREASPQGAAGLADEPSVRDSISDGADLTLFSGDKLLGGPQAGIIVGRAAPVGRLRKDPLMRAVRPDKLTVAALEATLRLYRDPATLMQRLPVLRMLGIAADALQATAQGVAARLCAVLSGAVVHAAEDAAYVGGGALPVTPWPTWTVQIEGRERPAEALAAALRRRETPVLGRMRQGRLVLDMRTVAETEIDVLIASVADAWRELA